MGERTATVTEPVHDCPGCTCQGARNGELAVYPPNGHLWGRCPDCGEVRWLTERWPPRYHGAPLSAEHCACCTHLHDLQPGGHIVPRKPPGSLT